MFCCAEQLLLFWSSWNFPFLMAASTLCAFAASPIISVWLPQLSFSLLFTTSRASITSHLDSFVLVLGVKEKGVWEALVLAMRLPGYHLFPLPFGHGSTLSLTAPAVTAPGIGDHSVSMIGILHFSSCQDFCLSLPNLQIHPLHFHCLGDDHILLSLGAASGIWTFTWKHICSL